MMQIIPPSDAARAQSFDESVQHAWFDSIAWVSNHSLQILIGVAVATVIVALLVGMKALGLRICRIDSDRTHWRNTIGRALSKTRLWFMIAVAAELVSGYAQAPALIANTIQFLFTVASTLQAAVWAREIILGAVEHRAGIDVDHSNLTSALGVIRVLVTIAIFAIAVVLILDNVGVNVTGLVAGLGIGGIAIGLAAQGVFRDLFAALSILFDKPFRIGQTIKFGDATGKVEKIGLKTTRLRAVEGEMVIISNDKLLDQQIRNMSDVRDRRVLNVLQLSYRNDPAVLASLPDELKTIVGAEPDCRFGHAWLIDLDAAAIKLELLYHVKSADVERMNRARHANFVAILRRLDELNVEMIQTAPPEPPRGKSPT